MQRKIRIKYFGEGRSLVSYIHMCVHMYQVKIILLMNFSLALVFLVLVLNVLKFKNEDPSLILP